MPLTANQAKLMGHRPGVTDKAKEIPVYFITTNHNQATIEGSGWANVLVNQAPVGTELCILADLDGTPVLLDYMVSANDGTDVTIGVAAGTGVAPLTENGSAIGGTNDGDLPSLTATVVARTSPIGTANGAYETVGATNSGDVSGAIMNNFREVDTVLNQLIADNVAMRAALREVAAKVNAIIS